jgi:NADH-quinone oxidoreductase subunit L
MVILGVLAVVAGLWNVTGNFSAFFGEGEIRGFAEGFFGILTHAEFWISLVLALGGILLAYAMYSAKWLSAERIGAMFRPLYSLFLHKYWLDELYEQIIVKLALIKGLFAGFQAIDTYGVDGVVNGLADGAMTTGRAIRKAHSGQLQLYGLFIGIGIIVIILCFYFLG